MSIELFIFGVIILVLIYTWIEDNQDDEDQD